MAPRKPSFRTRCELAAEHALVDVYFHEDTKTGVEVDDGFLHITFKGLRAAFFIGQDVSDENWNSAVLGIMQKVMPKWSIPDGVLRLERDDEDECPTCGRRNRLPE